MGKAGGVPPAVGSSLDERTGVVVAVRRVCIGICSINDDVEREEVRVLASLGPELVLQGKLSVKPSSSSGCSY